MKVPTIELIQTGRQISECARVLRASFGTVAQEFGLTEANAGPRAFRQFDMVRRLDDLGNLVSIQL